MTCQVDLIKCPADRSDTTFHDIIVCVKIDRKQLYLEGLCLQTTQFTAVTYGNEGRGCLPTIDHRPWDLCYLRVSLLSTE